MSKRLGRPEVGVSRSLTHNEQHLLKVFSANVKVANSGEKIVFTNVINHATVPYHIGDGQLAELELFWSGTKPFHRANYERKPRPVTNPIAPMKEVAERLVVKNEMSS